MIMFVTLFAALFPEVVLHCVVLYCVVSISVLSVILIEMCVICAHVLEVEHDCCEVMEDIQY